MRQSMKNTGVCPKCGSENVKKNVLGGLQNHFLGNIYQCKGCGYSEIWSAKNENTMIDIMYIITGVIGIGLILAVSYFAFVV